MRIAIDARIIKHNNMKLDNNIIFGKNLKIEKLLFSNSYLGIETSNLFLFAIILFNKINIGINNRKYRKNLLSQEYELIVDNLNHSIENQLFGN